MRNFLLIFFAMVSFIYAQESVTGGYGWNYENQATTTVKDSMTWANATLTVYYQLYPRPLTNYLTVPSKTSRFWAGKAGNTSNLNTLGTFTTAQCDSTLHYFIITDDDDCSWGWWIRFIASDGTNHDTSQAVRIGDLKGALTVFCYFDDVSTNLIREYLLIQGQ